MDPASATILFFLFLATEKAVKYAGGKVADSMTKPIWEALEEKARWLAGKDDTAKRWTAFVAAFEETRKRLETSGRHPELAKQVADVLNQFDLKTLPDNKWIDELTIQLEKASLVSEKPDEFLLVELFSRILPKSISRAELSETIYDFVSFFQDALFNQSVYKEKIFKSKQWERMRQTHYDTRERYIEQVIKHNENLDFVGIPELKDRQALRVEDVFISLQTQIEEISNKQLAKRLLGREREGIGLELFKKEDAQSKASRPLSITQALVESSKITVLGDPGSGKTTLLKYIILAFAENQSDRLGMTESRLPIFIRLYDYVAKREECGKDGFSFTDYLNKYCTDHLQLHLPPDFFETALENGECCVCLDGLDELGAAGLRREITLAVSALASRYPHNRFIVTSRIVGYYEAPLERDEFAHHAIQPLSDVDIKVFVDKWYKARERDVVVRRERTEHLVKTIMSEPRIKSLATNPLMLTIIALVHRIEAELPHERVKLYDKCVTTLVETWDKVRGIKTALRRRLLERIAYWMHSQPGEKGHTREVREGTLRMQVIHFLQSDPKNNMDEDQIQMEAEYFINLAKTRSGLLVERGEDVYAFSHLTFQEYLAACDIEKRFAHSTDAIWNEIQPKLHNAHWREVLLLLLGSLNRFEEHNSVLLRKIYEENDYYEPVFHRNLLLAAQALSDHVEVNITLYTKIVDDLLIFLLTSELERDKFVKVLCLLIWDSRIIGKLLELLRDESIEFSVRQIVANELGEIGRVEKYLRSQLVSLVKDSNIDPAIRLVLADRIVTAENCNEMCKELLGIVNNIENNEDVRLNALWALGDLSGFDINESIIENLIDLSSDETQQINIRIFSCRAVGNLGYIDNFDLDYLMDVAGDAKLDNDVRANSVMVIFELEKEGEAQDSLMRFILDDLADPFIRGAAARDLVYSTEKSAQVKGNQPVKSYQREVEKSWQNRARRDPHEEVKVFRKSDREHLEGSGSGRGARRTCSSARV